MRRLFRYVDQASVDQGRRGQAQLVDVEDVSLEGGRVFGESLVTDAVASGVRHFRSFQGVTLRSLYLHFRRMGLYRAWGEVIRSAVVGVGN